MLYYYITNLQGDVMQIVNSNGTAVASYEYDPYGNIISATGSLAEINPLRYRGYVYDTESDLYYLQSRYYDPNIGRFLNADAFASTGQGALGNNMFAYCGNNPIVRTDESGEFWVIAIIIGISVVATAHDVYQLSKEGEDGISADYTENNSAVQIKNSSKIITPWVQFGYSVYLNHFSEYKDYFSGSSIGMTYEWSLHNAGYVGFSIGGHVSNFMGIDGSGMLQYADRCKDVDLGPTIFDDDGSTKSGFSEVMKCTYIALFPKAALYDAIRQCLD